MKQNGEFDCQHAKSEHDNPSVQGATNGGEAGGKRRIYLNAFDMFTVGHLSFGQWRDPKDRASTKRRDLSYWTDLARLLERGDFNALFIADAYGQYDVYKQSTTPGIRAGAQFPMGDPAVVGYLASVMNYCITDTSCSLSPRWRL